jgi:hypothetical protein
VTQTVDSWTDLTVRNGLKSTDLHPSGESRNAPHNKLIYAAQTISQSAERRVLSSFSGESANGAIGN